MSDFPSFDSDLSAEGLNFTIHTELVPSGNEFKINTFVSSSGGAAFSFNSRHADRFSAEDIRGRHELITGKLHAVFSRKADGSSRHSVDFAAIYMGKEFRPALTGSSKMAENIKKILVFQDE